jgi:hypothetical protein
MKDIGQTIVDSLFYIIFIASWITIFTVAIRQGRKIRSLPKKEQRRLQKEIDEMYDRFDEDEEIREKLWEVNPANLSLTNPNSMFKGDTLFDDLEREAWEVNPANLSITNPYRYRYENEVHSLDPLGHYDH